MSLIQLPLNYRFVQADDLDFEDNELECIEDSRYYIQIGIDGVYAVNRIIMDANGNIVGANHLGVYSNIEDAKRCLERHVVAENGGE